MKLTRIEADKRENGKALPHMWSKCIGAGRAAEGLRAAWQKQLAQTRKECGFEYIRFHGLLAEDMFVCQKKNEKIVYNWQYIDQLYDALMEIGIRPIAEFGFMPPLLASGNGTQFWWKGNVTPPADYEEWGRLIFALVTHWKERYGLDEIRTWYYEVWNEPDLHAFWNGTKSQYFELYKTTVRAVKKVDETLRVGGPATSNFVPDARFDGETEDLSKHITHMAQDLDSLEWKGVWIKDFLEYCEKERLPVDFVSTHPYPTDFALDGQQELKGRSRYAGSLKDDMLWLKQTVEASPYAAAERHLTEWSSSPTSRDYSHDFLPAADYIIKGNLDGCGLADSLSYWVFTDIFEEVGGAPEAFHGGFGLQNVSGIKKPAYYAYQFLHQLGTEELDRGEEYIVTKTKDGKISALVYNYADECRQAIPIAEYPDHDAAEAIQRMGCNKKIEIRLTGLQPAGEVGVKILDSTCTACSRWAAFGYPENLTREQEAQLKALKPKEITLHADHNGTLEYSVETEPWAVVLIQEK